MTHSTTIQNRLAQVRDVMKRYNIQALIVPSADPHMSEYLPEHWQGRSWLSGFTGSSGTLVVAENFAYVWTDSRYWVQADKQLANTGIELSRAVVGSSYTDGLLDKLPKGAVVAIDGAVLSLAEHERLGTLCQSHEWTLTTQDILGEIWDDRPAMPTKEIYAHLPQFVDDSIANKLAGVRQAMADKGATAHLISSLDDIAWLTNLRGQDVVCNPVFLSHVLLTDTKATLFVDNNKLNDAIKSDLSQAGFDLDEYHNIATALSSIEGSILLDANKVAVATVAQLPKQTTIIKAVNPSTLLKAIKPAHTLEHIREAMRQDGAALCEFFVDLEKRLNSGQKVTEWDLSGLLIAARSKQPHYVSPSFETIAGFGTNGAVVHYSATADEHEQIVGDGLLLIDSGAQYQNGTTDITRMMGVGQVCDDAKRDVTYVLKAHIALAQVVFPANAPSVCIDSIARLPMWKAGLDYGHGTGHGVGYFLNVHEGPQSIVYYGQMTPEKILKEGMISSNEPGVYRTGKWGVRIENLVANVPYVNSEFGQFLHFETLTLCPIDTRIILPELLSDDEKAWLNSYHQKVHDELIGRVDGDAKAWLIERTLAI